MMHLQLSKGNPTHLSHFMKYVSAYAPSQEMVGKLEEMIQDALKTAKGSLEPVIVEQDCIESVFIVFPSGRIGLYRQVGMYEVIEG